MRVEVYSVDRSWGNVKANSDGEMYPSDDRKMHMRREDGDCLPLCGTKVLLNDELGPETGFDSSDPEVCQRCVRKSQGLQSRARPGRRP